MGTSDDEVGHGARAIYRRDDIQEAAVQAGTEVADTERVVRCVEAQRRGTAKYAGSGNWTRVRR